MLLTDKHNRQVHLAFISRNGGLRERITVKKTIASPDRLPASVLYASHAKVKVLKANWNSIMSCRA